jgi:hypothetical protein
LRFWLNMATDYAGIVINSTCTGIGIVIGTTIAELWIKPKIHRIRDRLQAKKIVEEEKKIIEQEIKKNDNP